MNSHCCSAISIKHISKSCGRNQLHGFLLIKSRWPASIHAKITSNNNVFIKLLSRLRTSLERRKRKTWNTFHPKNHQGLTAVYIDSVFATVKKIPNSLHYKIHYLQNFTDSSLIILYEKFFDWTWIIIHEHRFCKLILRKILQLFRLEHDASLKRSPLSSAS